MTLPELPPEIVEMIMSEYKTDLWRRMHKAQTHLVRFSIEYCFWGRRLWEAHFSKFDDQGNAVIEQPVFLNAESAQRYYTYDILLSGACRLAQMSQTFWDEQIYGLPLDVIWLNVSRGVNTQIEPLLSSADPSTET
jgi:hypothetical protein